MDDEYMTTKRTAEYVPGMTEPLLAQLRFRGTGPRFLKPSPRKVLYKRSDVDAWLESTAQIRTGEMQEAS
ncbi:helix-turn-helix transcriptional regulator [Curtobacterium sp. L1-20]|uniref:helix-turn-helix transcriptional regulator n=1 Tax=Curtobacterium sp. L1-20 TaxID=3138181 RepID=UPI003B51F068